MKLLLCIIDNFYTDQVEMEMKDKGYRMTEIAGSGGFLKKGNTTFMFGVNEEEVSKLKTDLKDICLAYEKHRGKRPEHSNRFTSFLLDVSMLPFFQSAETDENH
ncbi:cyclic-di-AMP receptor [Marinococcus sp. PL1-022]|jgi:uncharacterized protein YaaQ|uniref:cyclic-di-AMP receptor n=1 Tax=Marinococcus sp. PL1-022 TaxID=3095363 RepID=UPI002625B6A4|nr:cyclic-di-AMP receptor [Marinococcus sp. PL1-022]MDX6153457.1 cyclic-di-AMP receptor [Marinococcus sp. PL1-022]